MNNESNESEVLDNDTGHREADYLSKPGARLKKAREAQGLTQEQVAQELHLPPRFVVAIEADSYKDLPEPIFVRGYMRSYAQLVRLPSDDIAGKFNQCYAADTETPKLHERPANPVRLLGNIQQARPSRRKFLLWGVLFLGALLIAGLVWGGFITWHRHLLSLVTNGPAVTITTPDTLPSTTLAPAATLPATTTPLSPSTPARTTPADATAATNPPMSATAEIITASTMTAEEAASPDTLMLTLSAQSWVKVRDRRQQLISTMHPAGQIVLKGRAPFKVSIGNAAVATLTLNGNPIDLKPYTRGKVATMTLKP